MFGDQKAERQPVRCSSGQSGEGGGRDPGLKGSHRTWAGACELEGKACCPPSSYLHTRTV